MLQNLIVSKDRELNQGMRQGFTLLEVMLVLVMLTLVAFLAVPSFTLTAENVKSEIHKTNLLRIERAAQLYYLDVGKYPDKMKGLLERPKGEERWRGPYLEEMPAYPYDANLCYEFNSGGKVVIK